VKKIARSLTEQEARVIGLLLEDSPAGERDRLRRWGLPRSTYHHIRRRAYAQGWLDHRYIPDPRLFGLPWMSFLLVQPFADRRGSLTEALTRDSRAVHVAVGPNLVFTIHWDDSEAAAVRRFALIEKEGWVAGGVQLTTELSAQSVPVYFDYEGMWAHLTGRPGTLGYPRGLGGGPAAPGPMTSHQRWAVRYLLDRVASPSTRTDPGTPGGLFGLPFSVRRLLELGWISRRSILSPSLVPPYQGRTANRTYFVVGTPRSGARPEQLFQELVGPCQVFPFLFIVRKDRWLIGAAGGAREGGAADNHRQPVLPTIAGACEGIQIFEADGSSFRPQVNHRYDRLLADASSGPNP